MRAAAPPLSIRQLLLQALGLAGSWASRAELAEATRCGETRLDNELADLVTEGLVMFNTRTREYRLAGAPVARAALRQLLNNPQHQRAVIGHQGQGRGAAGLYRFGIAERRLDAQGQPCTWMAEVELPYPGAKALLALDFNALPEGSAP